MPTDVVSRRRWAAFAVSIALATGLVGCAGAGPFGGSNDNTSGQNDNTSGENDNTRGDNENATGVLTECVDGLWEADLDDLASQLGDHLAGNGLAVTSTKGAGTQGLSIGADGILGFANDMQFVVTIDMGGGLVMTVTQTHKGDMGASWTWDDGATDAAGTMSFSNVDDAAYSVTTAVDINGQAAQMPLEMPPVVAGKLPLAVTCDDGTLTTHAEGSPYTTTWRFVSED